MAVFVGETWIRKEHAFDYYIISYLTRDFEDFV